MLNKIITNFQEKRLKKEANKNYNQLVKNMVDYHEIINPEASESEVLIKAVIDIENKKAAGQLDELNQLKVA